MKLLKAFLMNYNQSIDIKDILDKMLNRSILDKKTSSVTL